jgi:uncharacterized protein (DUF433 family)
MFTIATIVNIMPSAVISLRVSNEQAKRLQRKARQLGRSASETGAILLDEGLRRDEFAFIEFRDSTVGRQACVKGSRLAVWQVVSLIRSYGGSLAKTAAHLDWPAVKVQAALNYAKAFPEEIEHALQDSHSHDFEGLTQLLPQIERFRSPAKKKST